MVDNKEHKGKIFLVPFGYQGATQFLFNRAIKNIPGNNFSSILYIGPTPRKIRDAQLSFIKSINSDSCIPPKFITIKQFISELFDEHSHNKKILSDFCKPLLIQKLKPELSIGYAQSIAEFIRETKQYLPDLTDAQLTTRILKEISSRGCHENDDIYTKVKQTSLILSEYNKTLSAKDWLDSEDIAFQVLRIIQDKLKIRHLILDGFFYDLTALEEKIVAALIDKSEQVYALSFYDKRTPASYALPQEFLTFLRKLNVLQEEVIPEVPALRTDPPYYVCASIEEEVEFIASHIKKSFLDKKLSLHQTIVCFSRLYEYETTVCRTFTKYQIPYSIYLTKPLSQAQPVIGVLELLRALINDHPRLSTAITLSSPYFSRFSAETKESIINLSKQANIIKSTGSWKGFSLTLQKVFKEKRQLSAPLTQKINKIQQEINTFLVLAETFRQSQNSLGQYNQGLRQLLGQFQWCETDLDRSIPAIKNEFYNILAMLDNFENAFGQITINLEQYLKMLEFFSEQTTIIPELTTGGVTILDFAETRGLDCDSLFFAGLSEDKFPGTTCFDPILPEWLKQKLRLPSIERHFFRNRFHYFRLVNTARNNTILSYYNTDQDRLLLPSPFLTGPASAPTKFDIIFSQEQQQQELGKKEKIDLQSLITAVDFSGDKEIEQVLNKRYGSRSKPSVTRLENYAYCPYLFYLQNILQIQPLAEPAYEIEPTFWGNVSHQVFERLYQSGAVPIEQLTEHLEKILNIVLAENKLNQFWTDVAKKIFHDFIPFFLKNEAELRARGFKPFSVENRLQARIKPCITITGRIDRLDQNPATKQLLILDYKTGKADTITVGNIEKGGHLQLPLYAFLAKKKYKIAQIADAGIYSVLDNKIYWLIDNKDKNINELINFAIKHAQLIIQHIRQGKFNLLPINASRCGFCDYASTCPTLLNTEPADQTQVDNLLLFDN
jgi:ATP-dependent helicase/DNAse subunit B